MATRSRTALFLRFREEAAALAARDGSASSTHSKSLLLGAHDAQISSLDKAPAWVRAHDQLKRDISHIRRLMAEISDAHRQALLVSFADDDATVHDAQITHMARTITSSLHRTEAAVKRLWAPPNSSMAPPMTPQQKQENTVRRNMQQAFAAALQDISIKFRVEQKDYLRKLEGQRAAVGESSTRNSEPKTLLMDYDDPYHVPQDPSHHNRGAMAQEQIIQIENAEAQAETREREIEQVTTSVNELALLMKDLASMVVDQGTLLDRIDYNIVSTADTTENAVEQLRQADGYQKKRLAFCCTVMLTIGCGIMTIMLLVKLLL